ncbi:hypothetical protein N0A02_13540 [Paraburkholderia acidicola]|uniref:ABC-three component systems C-terminal domain-containing protein n=1 Tax=Paraburkholderia acidicola TaxID=1912599 RepID=A0ABV1LNY3_9BURK
MVTTEASAKSAGYTYQFQRALFRIFSSVHRKSVIGIETDDDVVELRLQDDGIVDAIFEQDKHSVKKSGQPFQDSHKNLWHSVHVWLYSLQDTCAKYGDIKYCLVTNKLVSERALARKLGDAKSSDEIKACIEEIREKASHVSKEDTSEIVAVSSFSDEDLAFVVERIELLDGDGTVGGIPLKDATIQLFHLPDDLEGMEQNIYSGLLGHLVDLCQEAWLRREPAWLTKSSFAARLQSEISAHRMDRYLERSLTSTRWRDFQRENTTQLMFVAQLKHLGMPDEYCDRALSHYFGFYAERVRLLKAGEVLPEAWASRDAELHQRWEGIRDGVCLMTEENYAADDIAVAKSILRATLDANHRAKLDGRDTSQPYFTWGNYHELANKPDDERFVFWHETYAPKSEQADDEK